MALTESEAKITQDPGSGSSESSDEAVGLCKISPLTSLSFGKGKSEPKVEDNNGNNDRYDDDDDDEDGLVIDEGTSPVPEEPKKSKKESAEYKRQVSTPLKKRKVSITEEAPVSTPARTEMPNVREEEEAAIDPITFGLPSGWTRKITERMSGASAGKFDVYLTSPEGKRCRSMKEVGDHLEKTNSSFTTADFIFKPKNLKSSSTPAALRLPTKPQTKAAKKSPSKTPTKRASSAVTKEATKKAKVEEKVKAAKERKKRSPSKSATLQKKKGKEPRLVRKPPPEKASVKASKQQKFQRLLVKINFGQKGTDDSDLDSEEEEEEDSFDEGSEPEEEEMESPKISPKKSPRGSRSSLSD